jgi:anti-sigma regulatory factor (Ser/Thr protein kinase)
VHGEPAAAGSPGQAVRHGIVADRASRGGATAGGAAAIDSSPPAGRDEVDFGPDGLSGLRDLVADRASACGLGAARTEDLVLAVHELAANSVRHGGGHGKCRLWRDEAGLVCEISDDGWITDPSAGHRRPAVGQPGGRGLWLVNELCDRMDLRSSPAGTVVTVRMADGE